METEFGLGPSKVRLTELAHACRMHIMKFSGWRCENENERELLFKALSMR